MTTTLSAGRRFVILALLIVAVAGFTAMGASPAHADRCQPEELLGYDPLIPESAHPGCGVLIGVVYPMTCDNYTTLATCTTSLNVLGTGDLLNKCVQYSPLGDYACVGTGGVDNNGRPLFGPVDVAGITQRFEQCQTVDFAGGQVCVGGRRLIDR